MQELGQASCMAEEIKLKRFGLIGAAGYVAPRHLEAIKKVGGDLLVAVDPSDSVGIMDRHFPSARFFTDFERFAEYVEDLRQNGKALDFISICSPNNLHKSHVSFTLRSGCDAICEKPLVLEPSDIDDLLHIERQTGRKVNTILQLRLHPAIIELHKSITQEKGRRIFDVDLTYITSRGRWFYESWKGDTSRSGGIAANIGVHFFDMLSFVFGDLKKNIVHHRAADCAGGYLEYENARVRWFLSINGRDMTISDGFAQRCMSVHDNGFFDFSKGFENLHLKSYEHIVAGRGFPLADVRPSIETVAHIKTAPLEPEVGTQHPVLQKVLNDQERYKDGWPVQA